MSGQLRAKVDNTCASTFERKINPVCSHFLAAAYFIQYSYTNRTLLSMSATKAIKTIAFTATAQQDHTLVKLKNVIKWLKSGHEVRVQISGKSDRHKAMDNIFELMQKEVKSAAEVKQKVIKPDSIKFYLRPTEEAANLVVKDTKNTAADNDIEVVPADKDILSEDFEKELSQSIREESRKNRRK